MPRTGRCPNYARCLRAYRSENITIPDGAPFDCPECKQPLVEGGVAPGSRPMVIPIFILGGISILILSGALAVYIAVRNFHEKQAAGQIGTSFEQAEVAVEHGELMPSRHMASIAPSPASGSASPAPVEPVGPVGQVGQVGPSPAEIAIQAPPPNLDPQDPLNQRVKAAVLTRINLMPVITPESKEKLSMSVERARQMGRIVTIPLPSGQAALGPAAIAQLNAALASARLQPFLKDPACVLLVLGFAESQGDEQAALRVSTDRARSLLNTMRNRCGVLNVMHAIGMGGLSGNEPEAGRNGVVEVWAVLP